MCKQSAKGRDEALLRTWIACWRACLAFSSRILARSTSRLLLTVTGSSLSNDARSCRLASSMRRSAAELLFCRVTWRRKKRWIRVAAKSRTLAWSSEIEARNRGTLEPDQRDKWNGPAILFELDSCTAGEDWVTDFNALLCSLVMSLLLFPALLLFEENKFDVRFFVLELASLLAPFNFFTSSSAALAPGDCLSTYCVATGEGDARNDAGVFEEDLCDVRVDVTDSSSRSCSDCVISSISVSNSLISSTEISSAPIVLFERALIGWKILCDWDFPATLDFVLIAFSEAFKWE